MSGRVEHDYIAAFTPTRDGNPGTVVVRLSWAPWDPYAVVVEFPHQRQTEPWVFSWELLEDGLFGSVGLGDVRCRSDEDTYWITFYGSGKESGKVITLEFKTLGVADFLDDTVFDEGAFESVIDSELEQLFREAA
jgi:Streptomyces sporulation and cell division protein, SsgA